MADIIVTDTELAYFAGFFDGEGCVAIYPKKYVVSLTNTDIRPLLRAKELWGGFICSQSVESRRFAIRVLYRWQIYGHSARPFLEAIRPFVLLKGEQIDCYLSVLPMVSSKPGTRYTPEVKETIGLVEARLRLLKRCA